ncbi:MAG: NUDIX domain-containing protein [Myxococcales bacterium]|nr:NUDIX domain-containing protein [Myxococcales bacterium]
MLAAMEPRVAASAVVVGPDGRVVLVRRATPPNAGSYSLPGGKVRFGERIVDAVAREIREETGLVVEVGPLVEIVELVGDGYHYVVHDHVAWPRGGALVAGDDAAEAVWVGLAELDRYAVTDAVRRVIGAALGVAGA